MNNQNRFDILRGYYQKELFYPKGGPRINLEDLLHKLEFNDYTDFSKWYKSLTKSEIDDGKKDCCTGDCCQSILKKLIALEKTELRKIK